MKQTFTFLQEYGSLDGEKLRGRRHSSPENSLSGSITRLQDDSFDDSRMVSSHQLMRNGFMSIYFCRVFYLFLNYFYFVSMDRKVIAISKRHRATMFIMMKIKYSHAQCVWSIILSKFKPINNTQQSYADLRAITF